MGTLMSDYWRAYDVLGEEGFTHLKVNHSVTFKDPDTGAHTNAVESTWRHSKYSLPQYRRHKPFFPSQLAKYMFIKQCRASGTNPTTEFFRLAGSLYSPTKALDEEVGDDEQEDVEDGDMI